MTLIDAIDAIGALDCIERFGDEQIGVNIVRRALQEPARQIATNGGLEGSVVDNEMKSRPCGTCFFMAAHVRMRQGIAAKMKIHPTADRSRFYVLERFGAARLAGVSVAVFSALLWQLTTWRTTGAITLLALVVIVAGMRGASRISTLAACSVVYIVLPFQPYDISFLVRSGHPRFLRLEMGLYDAAEARRERRAEILLGGRAVTGWEPAWV